MFKTFKIVIIILGLGVFILPKQFVFAQNIEQCCEKSSEKENCCKTEKSTSCHTPHSKKHSDKNDCGSDCTKCHSCSVNIVLNFLSPEIYGSSEKIFVARNVIFNTNISFIFSNIQNIWQPPKIG